MITLSMYFQMKNKLEYRNSDAYRKLIKLAEGNDFLLFIAMMEHEIKTTLKDLNGLMQI